MEFIQTAAHSFVCRARKVVEGFDQGNGKLAQHLAESRREVEDQQAQVCTSYVLLESNYILRCCLT